MRVQHGLGSLGNPLAAIPKSAVVAANDEPQKPRADKLKAQFGKSWFHGWVVGQADLRLYGNRPPIAAAWLRNLKNPENGIRQSSHALAGRCLGKILGEIRPRNVDHTALITTFLCENPITNHVDERVGQTIWV